MPAILSQRLGAPEAAADVLIVPVAAPPSDLHSRLRPLGAGLAAAAARAVDLGDFTAEPGTRLVIHSRGLEPYPRILLLGIAPSSGRTAPDVRRTFAGVARDPLFRRLDTAAVLCTPDVGSAAQLEESIAAAVDGLLEGSYSWTRSTAPASGGPGRWAFLAGDARAKSRIDRGIAAGRALAEGVTWARDLANTPANEMGPQEMADAALTMAGRELKVRVIGDAALKKERAEGILAVGAGSPRPPRLIVAEYRPRGTAGVPPIALVGKGMIYDTGGLSIKPTSSMMYMKYDKCGGCVMLSTIRTVAALGLKVPVVAVVAAVENSVSGAAYRPGDIIGSRSGRTIEVLNTDAEGRIALADGLDYAITEFAPRAVLDAATLTGAAYHALSDRACAVLGNDDGIVRRLIEAGETVGERAWQLPLWPEHMSDVDTPNADVRNTGAAGGGTIAGAAFLQRFVRETPWAHLDIANVSRDRRNPNGGATGFGVRLLVEAIRTWPAARKRGAKSS